MPSVYQARTVGGREVNAARDSSRLEWAISAVSGQLTPAAPPDSELRQFTGTYGLHTVALVGDHLEHARSDRTCRMIPVSDDTFLLEGVYDQRLRFAR